jgi:small subunit ribosomal protein S19e
MLRKIYVHGPIGIEKLRADYGGRSSKGVKPKHATKAGGSVIRKALHQLETAGYIETMKSRGRRLTPAGRKLMKELAEELSKELVKELPELQKYQKGE